MIQKFTLGGKPYALPTSAIDNDYSVIIDNQSITGKVIHMERRGRLTHIRIQFAEEVRDYFAHQLKDGRCELVTPIGNRILDYRHKHTDSDPKRVAHQGRTFIRSIIPGKIVQTMVREGENVAAGQPLLSIEAMKMENEVTSPAAGKVTRLNINQGDLVEADDPLIEIEFDSK